MKEFTKSQLVSVAHDCHTNFHKDVCAPVDLFEVHESHDGYIYLVPNHDRHIDYFFGATMTFIGDYLNNRGVTWRVVCLYASVAIKLLDE